MGTFIVLVLLYLWRDDLQKWIAETIALGIKKSKEDITDKS